MLLALGRFFGRCVGVLGCALKVILPEALATLPGRRVELEISSVVLVYGCQVLVEDRGNRVLGLLLGAFVVVHILLVGGSPDRVNKS